MNLLINTSIAFNIAVILLFGLAFVLSLKENSNPKLRAKVGTFLAFAIFVYSVCLAALTLVGIAADNSVMASLIFFVMMLFIIGRFVEYKTLKIFSAIQLFSFALSLYVLFLIK